MGEREMSGEAQDLRDGVVAGLLAGVTVAGFFLLVDAVQAEPLRTPRFLAGAIHGEGEAGLGLVAAFTVLHLSAFAAIGAGAVALSRATELPLNPITGAVYGLFVCTLLFYGSLVATGTRVLPASSWPAVLAGNLLGGLVLGVYLRWRGPEPGLTGFARHLEEHGVLREGLVSGLIGAAVVAVWFLLLDGLFREAFFTPAALGSVLFHGATSSEAVRTAPSIVLGYTVIHVAAFFLFGMVVAALVAQAEKIPPFLFAVMLLGVVFEVFFVAMVASLATWVLETFAWWSVLGGNLLAALSMGAYLWRRHPELRERVLDGELWSEEGASVPPGGGRGPGAAGLAAEESTGEEAR